MIIQYLIFLMLVLFAFMLLVSDSGRHVALRRLLFLALILFSLLGIIFEGALTKFASTLGLSSGPDLITYLVTFAFFGYVITTYRWKRTVEDKVVKIIREIALKDKVQ